MDPQNNNNYNDDDNSDIPASNSNRCTSSNNSNNNGCCFETSTTTTTTKSSSESDTSRSNGPLISIETVASNIVSSIRSFIIQRIGSNDGDSNNHERSTVVGISSILNNLQQMLHHNTTIRQGTDILNGSYVVYENWILSNYSTLVSINDVLHRILFWIPYSSTSRLVWSLIEFHNFIIDIIIRKHHNNYNKTNNTTNNNPNDTIRNPYGTSIAVEQQQQNDTDKELSPVTLRMALTMIQSLWPIMMEFTIAIVSWKLHRQFNNQRQQIERTNKNYSGLYIDEEIIQRQQQFYHDTIINHYETNIRCYVERIRFGIRFLLLTSYWKQFHQEQDKFRKERTLLLVPSSKPPSTNITTIPGIMLNGGMLDVHNNNNNNTNTNNNRSTKTKIPTIRDVLIQSEREQYIGIRTGRRIVPNSATIVSSSSSPSPSPVTATTTTTTTIQSTAQQPSIGKFQLIQSYLSSILDTLRTKLNSSSNNNSVFSTKVKKIQIIIGEILYILRPLLQAEFQSIITKKRIQQQPFISSRPIGNNNTTNVQRRQHQSWVPWFLCLGVDVTSLLLLHNATSSSTQQHAKNDPWYSSRNTNTNGHRSSKSAVATTSTDEELKRRRVRLLLYLLRAPLWEHYTYPTIERTTHTLDTYLPFVGQFVSNYIWEYIQYYKYYKSEEG